MAGAYLGPTGRSTPSWSAILGPRIAFDVEKPARRNLFWPCRSVGSTCQLGSSVRLF